MASMEHECLDCQHVWFDNTRGEHCPLCGSARVAHWWDEEGDHDPVMED